MIISRYMKKIIGTASLRVVLLLDMNQGSLDPDARCQLSDKAQLFSSDWKSRL